MEGGQVRFDDESPNWKLVGKAFMTFLPSCKTVELLCGAEDVLMLFRYTENPPENTSFTPTALRVSAVASACTENSSFPYTPNVVGPNLRHFAGFSLACLARIALARASGFADTLAPAQYRSGASFIGAAVRPRRRR